MLVAHFFPGVLHSLPPLLYFCYRHFFDGSGQASLSSLFRTGGLFSFFKYSFIRSRRAALFSPDFLLERWLSLSLRELDLFLQSFEEVFFTGLATFFPFPLFFTSLRGRDFLSPGWRNSFS